MLLRSAVAVAPRRSKPAVLSAAESAAGALIGMRRGCWPCCMKGTTNEYSWFLFRRRDPIPQTGRSEPVIAAQHRTGHWSGPLVSYPAGAGGIRSGCDRGNRPNTLVRGSCATAAAPAFPYRRAVPGPAADAAASLDVSSLNWRRMRRLFSLVTVWAIRLARCGRVSRRAPERRIRNRIRVRWPGGYPGTRPRQAHATLANERGPSGRLAQ